MLDVLSGVPLFRAFRIQVILSWMFLAYALFQLLTPDQNLKRLGMSPVVAELIGLLILFGTVLVHEFGHSLTCKAFKGDAPVIVLWPLGGLAFVSPPNRPWAHFWTTVGGPATHLIMGPLWAALYLFVLPVVPAGEFRIYFFYACYLGIVYNTGLLAFNLIPAYPMDGGRILQEIVWLTVGYRQSLFIAGMVGTVAGAAFVALGFALWPIEIPWLGFSDATGIGAGSLILGRTPDMMLVLIGILCAMQSFATYKRSQELEGWRKN